MDPQVVWFAIPAVEVALAQLQASTLEPGPLPLRLFPLWFYPSCSEPGRSHRSINGRPAPFTRTSPGSRVARFPSVIARLGRPAFFSASIIPKEKKQWDLICTPTKLSSQCRKSASRCRTTPFKSPTGGNIPICTVGWRLYITEKVERNCSTALR